MTLNTPTSNPLALIVEDDVDTAGFFAESLKAAGYTAEVVYDGNGALERLLRVEPALVLLDMRLPDIPGQEILERIRADARMNATWVIIATGEPGTAKGATAEAADFTLLKPIAFEQLHMLAVRLRDRDRQPD